ncbi:hypothetical protein A3F65_03395 [Candidatus Saccharibacteria bacterium RIFCSPHIGHO2_12_FULL_47_16b]|nr:MAG: hypothetical protein A3F65_03395 [Candidatus Saccharibacteria bacterium RIFCSPHIGHO2_12_FULL_47_16b]OGL38774.1 MAG: hypothetical protein A3J32_02865 [Candidatus Saccharibacteria bacterium RIFCSPLOWO2_02_FULL_46_7]
MTATNHALTGAAIALAVKRPELAIPLAFASHFALDAIPHSGVPPGQFVFKKYFKIVAVDLTIAAILAVALLIIFKDHFWLVFSCMAVAAGPDGIWWFYRKNLEKNDKTGIDPISRFHWWIQWKEFQKGIYIELLWFGLMIFLITQLK